MADSVVGRLVYRIAGDLSGIEKSLKNAEKKVNNFTRFVKSAAGLFGAAAAFRALTGVAKDLIATYSVQEVAEAKVAAAIRATGREGQITTAAMADYAAQLQGVTTYGDEATLSAMAMVQQLANLDEEGLKQVTPLVQDLAAAMGIDLEQAAKAVGKTLGSNTNALQEYGITVDATAPKEQKLAQLTEQLRSRFGGMAQELATTGTGALQQFNNAMSDIKEFGGKALLDFLAPAIRGLTDMLSKTLQNLRAKQLLNLALKGEATSVYEVDQAIKGEQTSLEEAETRREALRKKVQEVQRAFDKETEAVRKGKNALQSNLPQLSSSLQAQKDYLGQAEREIALRSENIQKLEAERKRLAELGVIKSADVQISAAQVELLKYQQSQIDEVAARYNERIIPLAQKAAAWARRPISDAELAVAAYWREAQEQEKATQARVEAERLAAEQIRAIRDNTVDSFVAALGYLSQIAQGNAEREIALLEKKHKQELEGFAGTEEEKKALVEEFEQQKAKLEYEAALKSWKLQLGQAIVSGARAILSGFETKPFIPAGLAAGALATVLAGLQIAAVRAQKPVPTFSEGADFVVPPGYPNDSYPILVESGERVRVDPSGAATAGGQMLQATIMLDGRQIAQFVTRAVRNRQILVAQRGIVG